MKRSEDRILTTHTGSLHMPKDLIELLVREWKGEQHDELALDARLREGVAEVVRKQADLGIDIVNDGEFSKSTFMAYVTERMDGIDIRPASSTWFEQGEGHVSRSKDFNDFADYYREAAMYLEYSDPGAEREGREWLMTREWACTGPISYAGHDRLRRDIDNLKAAMDGLGASEAFMPAVGPGTVQPWLLNEHYPDDDSLWAALTEALRVEYKMIIDAGFVLQIDDPCLVSEWDHRQADGDWDFRQYRAWAEQSVEALNTALAGLPEDRIRYHLCWGSWNGPHSADLPLPDIVDLMLKINAQAYILEAANPRHEWEYRVWEDVKLPDGKILIPGVIEHVANVVEHPRTVAERIGRFANAVGRENVVAGTDCGFRLRCHPQIAWAKLRALTEGAEIASKELWGRS